MKHIFTTLFLFLGYLSVYAQGHPVSFNVEAGVNLSNFRSSRPDNTQSKLGLRAGVIAEYEFLQNTAIQTGFVYAAKGSTLEVPGKSDINIRANYLQAPVIIVYKIDIMEDTKIMLNAGSYLAYGIGGRATHSIPPTPGNQRWEMSTTTFGGSGYDFRRFDYGLVGGIGTDINRLLIQLVYEHGLRNIASSKEEYSYKNQGAYLTIGYKF